MRKKTMALFLLLAGGVSGFQSCKKDEFSLDWNTITINSVNSSYVSADDCTTASGFTGTNFTFSIDFSNPDNLVIDELEADLLFQNGNGFYSYSLTSFNLNGNTMTQQWCRSLEGVDYIDVRFFIVSEDRLRSQPVTYRLNKPE